MKEQKYFYSAILKRKLMEQHVGQGIQEWTK